MDQTSFNAMTQTLSRIPSRRDVLRGLAAAGLGLGSLRLSETEAARKKHKKRKKKTQQRCTPNCIDRTCGNDGCGGSCGACGTNEVCRGGNCCLPDSPGDTCGGRCGTRTNNCGQPVACATCATGQQCQTNGRCVPVCNNNLACPAGQDCLANGSCAKICTNNLDCTNGSGCGCSDPSVEGTKHCISDFVRPLVSCTSTTDCPLGAHCQDTSLGRVCVSVCQ